ncbi:hypothetical protein NI17_006535 [Thermobifida halotolerans]|uniref:Uncharacterized protein n=1 Tax=Thermobifida halotolerans TaxID=483545 RepID=A0A399G3E7_9ACTN|nr:hypothetical protein [Thermobifida halotolerans]UOE20837.1 hypothetical protein NI17_006535 [Thermobifida halotolerans]
MTEPHRPERSDTFSEKLPGLLVLLPLALLVALPGVLLLRSAPLWYCVWALMGVLLFLALDERGKLPRLGGRSSEPGTGGVRGAVGRALDSCSGVRTGLGAAVLPVLMKVLAESARPLAMGVLLLVILLPLRPHGRRASGGD